MAFFTLIDAAVAAAAAAPDSRMLLSELFVPDDDVPGCCCCCFVGVFVGVVHPLLNVPSERELNWFTLLLKSRFVGTPYGW